MNEVTTNTDPMAEFRERVLKKLQADIGEMMPDEALSGLIERAVEEQFFKPVIEVNDYGRETKNEPSWFVREVAKVAEPFIKREVANWITDHEDEIGQAVKQFLDDKSLMILTLQAMKQHTQNDLFMATQEIVRMIKQE